MFLALDISDFITVGFLVFLEGLLSLDNALVLALIVKPLPPVQRRKALTYGIWGAFLFRVLSLFFLTMLMEFTAVKIVGGIYLLWIGMKHFIGGDEGHSPVAASAFSFWRVVVAVELMDVAFSMDSILVAVSLTQKYWVVFAGGILGIIMMRFAAVLFVRLMSWFPRLEHTAYILVLVIGLKLLLQGCIGNAMDTHSFGSPINLAFLAAMLVALAFGFLRKQGSSQIQEKR